MMITIAMALTALVCAALLAGELRGQFVALRALAKWQAAYAKIKANK